MADHSRRTTILLTVVAILFILTIIILCLPYDIGHNNYPSNDKAKSDDIFTSTTKDPTTRRTSTTPTTTKSTTTHSTDIVTKRTPTSSTSSSTWSTSSTISHINTTESTTETTTLGHIPTSPTSSSTSSTSSTIYHVNRTENMTETTTLGDQPTSSTLSSTWSTSSTTFLVNAAENMTETTTIGNTDSTGTSLTDNVTQTELSNPTTEDNVNRTTDLSTEDRLRSTDESTSVVETEPTSTPVNTNLTSTTPTSTTTLSATSTSTTTLSATSTSTTTASTTSTSTTPVSTTPMVTTIDPFLNEPACNATECKDFSAKMWLQRDTSAVPCEDFYQYACGAVVDSQSLNPVDAGEAVKRKIREKILADGDGSDPYKVARDFYNSCLIQDPVRAGKQWSATSAWMDRQIPTTSSCDGDELTNMLAQLINHNFAPLFDVSLGLNDEKQFVTRVTPPIVRYPFSDDIAEKFCLKQYKLGLLNESYIDVEDKYEEYLNCTADGIGMEARLYYLELNLIQLGIQEPLLTETIDFYKKASDIKIEPFTSEELWQLDYMPMDLSGLKEISGQINWDKLLSDLFKTSDLDEGMQIQVYRLGYIVEMNKLLSPLLAQNTGSSSNVCNILHTLWKESRYMDLVSPQSTLTPYSEEYCLDLTTSLLPELLYSETEIQHIPDIQKVLESIRTIQNSSDNSAAIMDGNQALQTFDLMQDNDYTFNIFGSQSDVMSEDSYELKSLLLLKRFRSELYSQLFNNSSIESDNWKMYTAYENAAFHPEEKYYSAEIHMMEEPYYTEEEPAYLRYPGLGAALARSAIRNQKEQDESRPCLMQEEFQSYKSSNVYNMEVNTKKMDFARKFSKMVWDGYNYGKYLVSQNETDHLGQRDFAPLPMVESTTEQLFYIRSAQIHCEKTSRLDLLAVKERGHIPGPVRVNKILMNEPGFKRAFSCPKPQQWMKTEDICTYT